VSLPLVSFLGILGCSFTGTKKRIVSSHAFVSGHPENRTEQRTPRGVRGPI
jgi:hypothetical protein